MKRVEDISNKCKQRGVSHVIIHVQTSLYDTFIEEDKMMIKADFHMHTSFSGDSQTPMEEQINKAIDIGLDHICITDHLDLDFPEKYGYFDFDRDEYVKEVLLMEEKYRDKINIYLGIEFGLVPEESIGKRYEDIANTYPFDFILGSTHLVDWLDPYYSDYWEGKTDHQGVADYFNTILENIKTYNNYDSLGHLDYIVRYVRDIPEDPRRGRELLFDNYNYKEYEEVLDEILKHVIRHDKALEVNSAGYKYGLGAPNPGYSVLKRYKEMGGKLITIGADGHKPEHIAYDFNKVKDLLEVLGYKYYVIYKDRKAQAMKI